MIKEDDTIEFESRNELIELLEVLEPIKASNVAIKELYCHLEAMILSW